MENLNNKLRESGKVDYVVIDDYGNSINALEITFEAFGQKHKTYTHIENVGLIEPTLRKLCDTIHIEEVITKDVTPETFNELNLDNINKWNDELTKRFEDDGNNRT